MALTEVQRINGAGLARGWHADMLLQRAQREGRTMAEVHRDQIANAAAFSVPAEAVALRGGFIHYRFLDGSETRHVHQKRDRS